MEILSKFKEWEEKIGEVGFISYFSDPIVYVSGLPSLKIGEEIITEDGERGMSFDLKRTEAGILMFETEKVEVGKKVVRSGEFFKIPVSEGLLGRIVNPLCLPIDNLGSIKGKKIFLPIQRKSFGITRRVRVKEPLETGVTIVDLLIPLGYGQRETVIGDAKTGKTTFLLQTIAFQAKKGTISVYVGIAKEATALKEVEEYLRETKALEKTVIVATTSDQSPALHYLAPLSGITIAEYFRDQGKNVIVVFDDLTTHAKAYREISLLLKRPPGREAYPGDIFHLHAALMERAGRFVTEEGKHASITAFPVVETIENEISGYIPTNILAMTDGHIFFDSEILKKGQIPPVNDFLSVSRVGKQTRGPLHKDLMEKIKRKLTDYRRVLEVAVFGAELSEENKKILDLGEKINVIFLQDSKNLIPPAFQYLLFGLLLSGFWKDVSTETMKKELQKLYDTFLKGDISDLEREIAKINSVEKLKDFCEEITLPLERFL